MSWSDRLYISQVIGCATGLVLALLFVMLIARVPRQSVRVRPLLLLMCCGVSWNLAGVICGILMLNGALICSPPLLAMHAWAAVSAGLLPSGLVILCRDRLGKAAGWLGSSWFLWLTASLSAILATGSVVSLYGSDPQAAWAAHAAMFQIAFTAVACATALLRVPHRSASEVVYALTTAGGASVMAAFAILHHVLPQTPETAFRLGLMKQDGGLLMMVGCFFLFGNFRLAHVFVKQSLRILMVACLSPLLWFLLSGLPKDPKGFLVASGCLFAVGVAFPLADRAMGFVVDRWLLRRPDFAAIARQTWQTFNQLDSEAAILNEATGAVHHALGIDDCTIRPAAEVSAECLVTLREGDIHESCFDQREVLVPVRTGDNVSYAMVLRQGCHHPLLSEEVRFLLTMASQLGSRLDALRLERERMERQSREARLQGEIVRAELRALQAQINPHFLFNSLNAIAELIVADPERAEEMTLRLAKVFRYVLSNSDRQMVSVAEEMEFLQSYLRIEEARFGGRLRISFDVDQGVRHESIPCLLLQPVVENAIKHGLAPKVGQGRLAISARRNGEFLCLEVSDDGLGPPPKPLQAQLRRVSTGVGLRNVTERLKTLYEGKANLEFDGVPMRGSRVTIQIPCPILL